MENQTAAEQASSVKKRKTEVAELVTSTVLLVQLNNKKKKPRRSGVVTVTKVAEGRRECIGDVSVVEAQEEDNDTTVCASPRNSGVSDHVNDDGSCCCSSNGSSELVEDGNKLKLVDLKDGRDDEESDEVESLTYNPLRERTQMTPSANNLQRQTTPAEPWRGSAAAKMPSELELEEFFTAAEKDIKDKFAKKYNYDITKDEPLEGRYEWTRLKPSRNLQEHNA